MKIIWDPVLRTFRMKDAAPSGGALSPTDIEYAALLALYNAGTMTPGFYRITDRADDGIILEAVTASSISLHGVGIFLVPDFESAGTYTGVLAESGIAYTTTEGVWAEEKQYSKVAYDTLAGGTFTIGGDVIDSVSGAQGVVITDDGVGELTCYRTTAAMFGAGHALNDGAAVTANSVAVTNADSLYIGDVVFWNGLHYQLINMDSIGASNPSLSPSYYQLPKSIANVGYVKDADYTEYDLVNDIVLYRKDRRKNSVYYYSGFSSFQWGNNAVKNNISGQEVDPDMLNQRGSIDGAIFEGLETYPVFGNDFTGNIYQCYFRGLNDGLGRYIRFFDTTQMDGCTLVAVAHTSFSGAMSYSSSTMNAVTSNFATSIDITGLTTLDITALLNYVGIVILTSSNATESIDTISNFPLIQPVRFFIDSGLTVTFVHGTGGGNPQCSGAVNAVLDGNNGDFIDFTKLYGKIKQTGGDTF